MSGDEPRSTKLMCAIELLDQDLRPSFILNLAKRQTFRADNFPVIHYNPALARNADLKQAVLASDDGSVGNVTSIAFRDWVRRDVGPTIAQPKLETHLFHEIDWTIVRLPEFLIVSGLPRSHIPAPVTKQIKVQDSLSRALDHDRIQVSARPGDLQEVGWSINDDEAVDLDPSDPKHQVGVMARIPRSAHMQFFYNIDWASTELGAINTWSDELHQMCAFIMADPGPALLFWGRDFLVIHNAAAPHFFPQVQESFMGSTVERTLPQIWTSFASIFSAVRNTRQVVEMQNIAVLLYRRGELKEFYISYRYIPIENRAGDFLGIYQTLSDVTAENLSRRRLATLLKVSACSAKVTDESVFWQNLLSALATNKEDIGFALLYSLELVAQEKPDLFNQEKHMVCILQGTLGISESHTSVVNPLTMDRESVGYGPIFRRALEDGVPVLASTEDGTLPREYMLDVHCRGFQAPCQAALVCPIRPTGGTRVIGFLVIGLSSRVEYDSEYQQFIDILNRHIATSAASMALFNEEIRRERDRADEAALVYTQLQARLKQKTQALATSEAKLERMTDCAPVGIVITNDLGQVTYANEAWYTITGHAGTEVSAESWMALVNEEDAPNAAKVFGEVMATKKNLTFELRLKRMTVRQTDDAHPIEMVTWVLTSVFVFEEHEDGRTKSLFSSVTDISVQKWAEEVQRRKMLEALELKAQQESFIDTISHEMRNPLSAVLQSVDEISEYLALMQTNRHVDAELTRGSKEAAEVIALCCQHQRRVIDDVLTLSKMNTNMLLINRDNSDPLQVVSSVIKIFSGDAKKHGISLKMHVEDSVRQMGVSRLLFDASRLSQVLVNLLGNAIKFTRDSAERQITVIVGVFPSRPTSGDHGVDYVQTQPNSEFDLESVPGKEVDRIYLRVVVRDTGIGMNDEEKRRVFGRFSQASPRTHIRYGGSGLGLFISKKLTELQGGAIGLKMGDDKGTTFAFYVDALWPSSTGSVKDTAAAVHTGSDASVGVAAKVHGSLKSKQIESHQSISERTILVVEDNLINQKVISQQLRKKGYIVWTANNGLEALEFLEQTKFWSGQEQSGKALSAILLDIEMPVMDGLTCVRRIRQLEAEGSLNGHIPVISVSANARLEQIRDARSAGMDENVSKPFRIADLIPILESLLS